MWVAYRPRGIRIAEAVKLADAEKHIPMDQSLSRGSSVRWARWSNQNLNFLEKSIFQALFALIQWLDG